MYENNQKVFEEQQEHNTFQLEQKIKIQEA